MFDAEISMHSGSSAGIGFADPGRDAQITVFLNRQRFEFGIEQMLKAGHGREAVLYLAVRHADGSAAAVSHRTLSLVANTLRAGMRSGAVAYLGEARFAVLLQGTDEWQAAAYARVAVDIVNGMRLPSGERTLPIKACVGGVLAGHDRDGARLLALAEAAADMAWDKPGSKLHLLHAPQ